MLVSSIRKNHPTLSNTAILLYLLIYEKIKKTRKNSVFYKSKEMQEDLYASDKLCSSAVAELEEVGLILVDRSSRSYVYSLGISPTDPPRDSRRNSDGDTPSKESPINNNIISISGVSSDKSDNHAQDIDSDPFADADLGGIEADAAQVRLVFDALRGWRGKKPLYIRHYAAPYKVELYPAEIRSRMRELTPEHIEYVCRSYAAQKEHIRHVTAWLQSALYYAPERMAREQTAAIAVGETHTPDAPPPAAPRKPRPKFSDFKQRAYSADDYAAIERMALAASDATLGGGYMPSDLTRGAMPRAADRHIGGAG